MIEVLVPKAERVLGRLVEGSEPVAQCLRPAERQLYHDGAIQGPGFAFQDVAKKRLGSEKSAGKVESFGFHRQERRDFTMHEKAGVRTSAAGLNREDDGDFYGETYLRRAVTAGYVRRLILPA